MKIRYDTTIWFRDEEVCNIRNEEVIVDAGRWMQLCVINLQDELTELEERGNAGGILIVPGVLEEELDSFGQFCGSGRRSCCESDKQCCNFCQVGCLDACWLRDAARTT